MALPDTHEHSHQHATEAKDSSQARAVKTTVPSAPKSPNEPTLDTNSDDDADVSDLEDDEDSNVGENSQKLRVIKSSVRQHKSLMQEETAARTSSEIHDQSASQLRKSSKRSAEEEIQPEHRQSTLKKRKALQDISGSNSRANVLASAFEPSEARPASAQSKLAVSTGAAVVEPGQQKPRSVSSSSSVLRASKSGNNWPRMQDSTEFGSATLADQRAELNCYRRDLFNYIGMIQAGAIPVQFVKSFLGRLDIHISQMDNALQAVEELHKKEKKRQLKMRGLQSKINELCTVAMMDQLETDHLISELTLPATYDT